VPAPEFELKQAIASGAVSLGKEEVMLVFCVDVCDSPAIPQDFDRLLQPRQLNRPGGILARSDTWTRKSSEQDDGKKNGSFHWGLPEQGADRADANAAGLNCGRLQT